VTDTLHTPALAERPADLRRFTIHLPVGLELINSNQSQNPRRRARIVKEIRTAAEAACLQNQALRAARTAAAPGPVLQHAHILGVLHPEDHRRRDAANWYPSFKAAVDGVIDAGVLEDDDSTHVIGPDMRRGSIVKGSQLVLHVREAIPGVHGWLGFEPEQGAA
jgi:hypothetical protein